MGQELQIHRTRAVACDLLRWRVIRSAFDVNRLASFRTLAALGILALGLALAGCGLKGALDPPPAPAPPPQAQLEGEPAAPGTPPEAPQPPPRRSFFLDWLLD
jgi:predicted small lipoprotein YifL